MTPSAEIVLYAIPMSHPARAVHLMLARQHLDHRVRQLPAGLHALLLRGLGFEGTTVPALTIGDRRAQGSLQISRLIDELGAGEPLYPSDPERRDEVEWAERWGEGIYQPIPRRLFRWGSTVDRRLRIHIARESHIPLPRLTGWLSRPGAVYFAGAESANERAVRDDLAALPRHIDRVDALIEAAILDSDSLNPADFQIGTTSRVLMNFPRIRPLFANRPAETHALRVCPRFGGDVPLDLPPPWLRSG